MPFRAKSNTTPETPANYQTTPLLIDILQPTPNYAYPIKIFLRIPIN